MANLELLKTQINDLLINKLGEPDDTDLVLIKREAQECGLDNRQFDRLLQEIYTSINWSKVRDEREGEDRVVGAPIYIFDLEVKSLNKLGEVLFNHPGKAQKYLTDDVFLKANVNYLSHQNIDLAIQYADLYHSENDKDKRYLKICYRLNPQLPYRIDGRTFLSVEELLAEGFKSRALIDKIYQHYVTTRLQIWLHAQDRHRFNKKNEGKTMVSFLTFVYQINPQYPFYIEKELFYTPQELVARALVDLDFRKKIGKSCANGNLFVWFDALGQRNWQIVYESALKIIQANDLLGNEEKDYASVQELLYLIDPGLAPPVVIAGLDRIENLSLAATKNVVIPVSLSLTALGFVKPVIRLQNEFQGIELDNAQVVLFDLTGQKQAIVNLYVDPQKLDKNTEYQTVLQIISPYQTIDIPVRLKTVFPLRTFVFYLVKYSLFGAMFFGFFRWLLFAGTGRARLSPQIITTAISRSLPDNYPIFYWVFITMLITFVISIVTIRKVEKI